jgi:thymidylate synthase
MGLGVPFNIASYAALTYLLAKVCGLRVGTFVHSLSNTHIYMNHEDALYKQLMREPTEFPQLVITKNSTNIDDFTFEDFELSNYNPQGFLRMKMAV